LLDDPPCSYLNTLPNFGERAKKQTVEHGLEFKETPNVSETGGLNGATSFAANLLPQDAQHRSRS
jgi:hypothetical protein